MRLRNRWLEMTWILLACAGIAGGCGSDGGAAGRDLSEPDSGPRTDRQATRQRPSVPRAVPNTPAARAERIASRLSLAELAGQVVMTKLEGTAATTEELASIRSHHLGGIILFGANVADEAQLRSLLQTVGRARRAATSARVGLVVSVDQEGGDIRNVPFAPPEQSQPELAGGGPSQTRATALATGRGLRALGITMVLGPVADLAAPPNRTMTGRSFGEDARAAAPHVAAYVRGLQAGGVAAAAKHFPGFGASTANSDEAVAWVDRTRAQLLAEELVPFRAAVAAQTAAVMVSHGIHRQLGSTLPGTLDRRVATGLLRGDLGYEGVAMTDSMNAIGMREAWGGTVPEACPQAVGAGIDLVLLTGSMETARKCQERLVDAVRGGSLPIARLREAVARVLALQIQAEVRPASSTAPVQ